MSIEGKIVKLAMLNRFYQELPSFFVKKETGKGLSTNDYTDAEKADVAKIADIETALDNKVEAIQMNYKNAPEAVTNKKVIIPSVYTDIGDGTYSLVDESGNTFYHFDSNPSQGISVGLGTGQSGGGVSKLLVDKNYVDNTIDSKIATELANITGVDFIIVAANEELPATGVSGKFYLKATGATGSNKYDEYVWVNHGTAESPNYGYEKLGTMDVDLTGYIKESDLQFATAEDILAIFNSGGN